MVIDWPRPWPKVAAYTPVEFVAACDGCHKPTLWCEYMTVGPDGNHRPDYCTPCTCSPCPCGRHD